MTTADIVLVSLAVIQVLALVLLGVTGYLASVSARRTLNAAKPALGHASAIAGVGQRLAQRVQTDGLARVRKVQALVAAVKKRVETPLRIARELKPGAQAAATEARQQGAAVQGTTARVGAIARGLARIRTAAQRAREASREE